LLDLASEKARPSTLLVVNVGAGFTDFALLNVAQSEDYDTNAGALLAHKGGVGTGLGVWDNALKTLLFNRVREVAMGRKKVAEFKVIKAKLDIQARGVKEALMATEESLPVDVSPVLTEPVCIERSELESSLPVKAALFGIRDGLRVFIKDAIKTVGMHRFNPGTTEILVTGGGALLPSVVNCIREAVATLGPAYPAKVRADYVSPPYASVPKINGFYPLLAASLGSTEKEYPDEQVMAEAAVANAPAAAPPTKPSRAAAQTNQGKAASRATGKSNRFRLT
jgi:hypothetical protein